MNAVFEPVSYTDNTTVKTTTMISKLFDSHISGEVTENLTLPLNQFTEFCTWIDHGLAYE